MCEGFQATASQSPGSMALCTHMMEAVSFRSLFRGSRPFIVAPSDSFPPLKHHKTFHTQDRIYESSNTFAESPNLHSVFILLSFVHGFACSFLL